MPLSNAHETTSQSLTSLKEPADATTSQVTISQTGQPQDLSHEIGAYSCSSIVPSSYSDTLFVEELPSIRHQSLLRKEFFSTLRRPYKSIYANPNPSPVTSLCSQPAFEPTQEEVLNCFDNDDEISPPDLSPIHDATPNEDSSEVLVTEQSTGFVGTHTNYVSDGIAEQTEGGLTGTQQDGNTSGQEEGGHEEDSEFEFVAEDTETDSGSEADLSPDEEAIADRDLSHNHAQSHHSLAKSFLEHTWNHLCDCENEESSSEPGQERVLSLKQMAQYWQALGVPDAIGSTALPEVGPEQRHIDWFSVLGGGEQRPHLRLEASQEIAPIINRTWDVDSIILWATCLSINRGLYLSYFPTPVRNLQTNLHVFHQGQALNRIPHLRLGNGRQSPEFDVLVLFPGMAHASRTTSFLRTDEHRLWVNRFLLPAIREVCPQDVIQYHPRSFEDAESKTYSRRRETCSGRVRNNMDMHHYLPPEYLEDIWRHVSQNAELSELNQFHGLFIVLSAKNIKLAGRSSSFQECRAKVIDHLCQVLDWDKADLSNTWIDVGLEDTAASGNSTFLMKSHCLPAWVASMRYSKQSPLVAAECFNWNLTSQAGSARVETRKTHPLRKGGIPYAQRYNVNKDLFSTASKRDHGLFGEPPLEGMACPPSLLDAWIVAARQHRNSGQATTSKTAKQLRRLRKVFEAMKYRIGRALDSALTASFSAREEYRISWELFLDVEPSAAGPSGGHRPFWILPTSHVNEFMRWEFNRWISAIEFVRLRGTLRDSTWEGHQRNMIMATILLRSLKASINCHHVAKRSQMFKDKYKNQKGEYLRGLNFESSMRDTGLAWLPRDLFNWGGLHLQDELVTSTSFTFNGLQGMFRNWQNVNTVNEQYSEARALEHRLQTCGPNGCSDVMDSMRQMVYQQFTLHVIQQLRTVSSVEDVELDQGCQGLSFDIVHSLLGEQPFLAQVRGRRSGVGNTYPERVHGLFNWDDGIPRTFWDQCYYRQLSRKFHKSISVSVSPADAENWKASLGKWALPYFWIIPNYNKHTLFTCLAKTANRSAVTRAFISGIYKWNLSDGSRDFSNEEQWLFGGDVYLGGRPRIHIGQRHGSPGAAETERQTAPTRVINFGCDIPFTEVPILIEDGFETQRGLYNVDVNVLAHFQAAHDCLRRSLGEPICDVLLIIVLTFCSSTVTPSLPVNGGGFAAGSRRDPGLLAVTLVTRMLWFLHPRDFPWDENDGLILRIPDMVKKIG